MWLCSGFGGRIHTLLFWSSWDFRFNCVCVCVCLFETLHSSFITRLFYSNWLSGLSFVSRRDAGPWGSGRGPPSRGPGVCLHRHRSHHHPSPLPQTTQERQPARVSQAPGPADGEQNYTMTKTHHPRYAVCSVSIRIICYWARSTNLGQSIWWRWWGTTMTWVLCLYSLL